MENNIVITNLKNKDYLKKCYKANYIIKINNDIIDFAKTKKEAEKIKKDFIKTYKKEIEKGVI